MREDRRQTSELQETVIEIRRVSKKTKGGNQIRFTALVVVGDKKGKVGVGLAKAPNVVSAIRKSIEYAKRRMLEVPLEGTTIPYEIRVKFKAAQVIMKPARPGSGIIAGGTLRMVLEALGVRDVITKMLGSTNKKTNVYAAMEALEQLKELVEKKKDWGSKNAE